MPKGRLQLRLTPEALAELERRAGGKDKRQAYIEAWLTGSQTDASAGSRNRETWVSERERAFLDCHSAPAPSSFNDPAREKRQQARKERKAVLAGTVKEESEHRVGPTAEGPGCFECSWLDGKVYKFCSKCETSLNPQLQERMKQGLTRPATYCPRHTPKSCEPECPHRVNVG